MAKKFELIATSGKGLNHQAIVTEYDESNADLTSYTTEVMHLIGGKLFREKSQPQSIFPFSNDFGGITHV